MRRAASENSDVAERLDNANVEMSRLRWEVESATTEAVAAPTEHVRQINQRAMITSYIQNVSCRGYIFPGVKNVPVDVSAHAQ